MKAKQTTLALGIAAAAGMAVVCLKDGNRRQQMKNKMQAMLAKWKGQKAMANENVFKLGNPKPSSADSKMVDEGSLYSIKRYNEKYQEGV